MDSSFKWLISVITYLLGVGGHACCCSWVFVSLFETQVGEAVLDGIPAAYRTSSVGAFMELSNGRLVSQYRRFHKW